MPRPARKRNVPTWDILIASIVHRTDLLTLLLKEIGRQRTINVRVRVCRDNLETQYGDKCQKLLESSEAEYVSFLDDDDWIEPDFIDAINDALHERPDYVGFKVRWTEDGVLQLPVEHTLRHGGWANNADMLIRDIVHFNPIRREIALTGRWQGGGGADIHWADQVRNAGQVKTEVFIDRVLHHYRHAGWSFSIPAPMLADIPPRPYADGFVTWVD